MADLIINRNVARSRWNRMLPVEENGGEEERREAARHMISNLIDDAITLQQKVDTRVELAKSIVLCGGTALIPGFKGRPVTTLPASAT